MAVGLHVAGVSVTGGVRNNSQKNRASSEKHREVETRPNQGQEDRQCK